MTRMVICLDDARNTTGCGNGHLQDGDGEAIRSDCQARMATGHPNGMGRGNSKGKDRVKDCREHGSSGTGRDDLRGRQTPSLSLYVLQRFNSSQARTYPMPLSFCLNRLPLRHKKPRMHPWATPGHQDRNQHPLPQAESRAPQPARATQLHHFFIHRVAKSVEWTVAPPSASYARGGVPREAV